MEESKKEYIVTKENVYEAESVTPTADGISFTVAGYDLSEIEKFRDDTEIKVAGEDLNPYGIYANLKFASATVDSENNMTVSFNRENRNSIEERLSALEASQTVQDDAIAEMAENVYE